MASNSMASLKRAVPGLIIISAAVAIIFVLYEIKNIVARSLESGGLFLLTGTLLSSNILWYQVFSFLVVIAFLLLAFLLDSKGLRSFLRIGRVNAEAHPVPLIGLKPQKGEGWRGVGLSFLIIITAVTAIVIYLQTVQGHQIAGFPPSAVLWILIFSLMNSFNEEAVFRVGLVSVLHGRLPAPAVTLTSGIIFGIAHYGGHPGGVPGVFLAGFLGWFLAKSVIETRGIFWAWTIHFAQDVVIYTGLFLTLYSTS